MKIVYQKNKNKTNDSILLDIVDAISFGGHEVFIWSEPTPAFDVLDKIKPDIIIHNELSELFKSKCECKLLHQNDILKNIAYENKYQICNPLLFYPVKKLKEFEVDKSCIIRYPEIEDWKNLPIEKDEFVRIYSEQEMLIPQYCGNISKEFYKYVYRSSRQCLHMSPMSKLNCDLVCGQHQSALYYSTFNYANKLIVNLDKTKIEEYLKEKYEDF